MGGNNGLQDNLDIKIKSIASQKQKTEVKNLHVLSRKKKLNMRLLGRITRKWQEIMIYKLIMMQKLITSHNTRRRLRNLYVLYRKIMKYESTV